MHQRAAQRTCRAAFSGWPTHSIRTPASFERSVTHRAAIAQSAPAGLSAVPWEGTPAQQQALELLRTRMAAQVADVPDEQTLKWYLRDRYFDVAEAEQKLTATLKWRNNIRADHVTLDDVQAEYSTGKSYVHDELDKLGRPVLVIRACRHKTGEFPIEGSKRLCAYSLDTALSKLPPNGEQILGVIDLRDMNLTNIDLPFVAFMVDAFFVYYPRRMSQVLLVDAPWIFKAPWEVIKPLLRKYQALVRFVSRKELQKEYFTKETLPELFRN